jgi:TnpA family transposase
MCFLNRFWRIAVTAIERTAYPRFKQTFTEQELEAFYTLSEIDKAFVREKTSGRQSQLALAILLKGFQKLGYLPELEAVPNMVKQYIAQQLTIPFTIQKVPKKTRKRYRRAIHAHLKVKRYGQGGVQVVQETVKVHAKTMSDPADLINVAVEQLVRLKFELPAFSTLDRIVNHLRHQVHLQLYAEVTRNLTSDQKMQLDKLLIKEETQTRTPFARLKVLPATATIKEIRKWEKHLDWLETILNPQSFLKPLPSTKIEQFASQAYQMEIGDIRGTMTAAKRYTLLLCLLHQMQVRTRDQLTIMYLRRLKQLHNSAKKRLRDLREKYREMNEGIINTFAEILQKKATVDQAPRESQDAMLGKVVREIIEANGGTATLQQVCDLLQALHDDNYLPLLPYLYRKNRGLPFRLTQQLEIRSATQSKSLLTALEFIQTHYRKQPAHLPDDISLSFATSRWQSFIREKIDGKMMLNKHHLEICVFSGIADGLRNGDLYVVGADTFADYRSQLLPWEECQALLETYCQAVGLPTTAKEFVKTLKKRFTALATQVDDAQAEKSDLFFDAKGKPHLKKLPSQPASKDADTFKQLVYTRLPERHLLDILHNVHHWLHYTRHFGPPSGSDTKLQDPVSRYLITVFGYGCNLGPAQTARHARSLASERTIGRINAQHITTAKLDAGIRDVINEYARFSLPFIWGSGKAAIADGTQYELYENNLLGERHIRYGGYGGIAYHHISDTYVALFSRFIACGVWEAVYILDGLLENKSVLQPDKVHADTQGQSEVVFGLSHLLGIQLMPRMRNWDKVAMYRPDKNLTFQHIEAWFTRHVNWKLIEEHWQDLMQVILSIHTGKLLPSWLLQKLATDNPKNKLYKAFKELGCVIRSMFLLKFVSTPPLRHDIQDATSKMESYNGFSQWVTFGGWGILKSRDPVENEKRIKYKDLIANAIMLQNVVDLTDVMHDLVQEGHLVSPEFIVPMSPYMTEHIKRFGEYVIDTTTIPPPLQPDKTFLSVQA